MFVVTLPLSATNDPRTFARRAKRAGADVLEIRTDLTPNVENFSSPIPLLVSVRGNDMLSDSLRPAYIDCEHGTDSWVPKGAKLIRSFHDYEKTPSLSELKKLVLRMRGESPWAIKVATFVKHDEDLLTLSRLQNWLSDIGQRGIVLGMGSKAHLTRIMSPLHNVFTYTTLNSADAAAPGQLPISFYTLTKGRKHPKIFGIIGGPHIVHSLSPVIHNALMQRHKIDGLYSCFPSEDFSSTIKVLKSLGVKGLSVTAPFKRDAYDISLEREPIVKKLGVANTLVRVSGGYRSFLSDSYGIREGYGALKTAKNVAILGAGGAVPSAIEAVRQSNEKAHITVFARDPKKAKKDLRSFGVDVQDLVAASMHAADLVLCAMSADVSAPMPSPMKNAVAIDLRYGYVTAFMRAAQRKGFRVHDGTSMLIHQALKQFRHFTGKAPYDDDETFLRPILTSFLSSHGQ